MVEGASKAGQERLTHATLASVGIKCTRSESQSQRFQGPSTGFIIIVFHKPSNCLDTQPQHNSHSTQPTQPTTNTKQQPECLRTTTRRAPPPQVAAPLGRQLWLSGEASTAHTTIVDNVEQLKPPPSACHCFVCTRRVPCRAAFPTTSSAPTTTLLLLLLLTIGSNCQCCRAAAHQKSTNGIVKQVSIVLLKKTCTLPYACITTTTNEGSTELNCTTGWPSCTTNNRWHQVCWRPVWP